VITTTSKQNSNKQTLAKPAPESVSKINPGFAKPA